MSEVPSNLIPTRITQLPTAPVADENSLMMIVYQGVNYQIRVGDLLAVAGVPTSRQVLAGTGLTGGGALTDNVTLSVAPGGIGSVQLAASGVTAGSYGTATDIPVFTVDETGRVVAATTLPVAVSGVVPDTRQVIAGAGLSGGGALTANVTLDANLSSATPLSVDTTGAAGTSDDIARADHRHPAIDLADDDQVDNILGLSNGGTARSLVMDEGALIWSGADGLYVGPVGTPGQVLLSSGATEYVWVNQSALHVGQSDNVYGGAANRIVVQLGANSTGFITAPTSSDTFLKWTGSAFVWDVGGGGGGGGGTVTSIDASGGTTGLSFTGGPIITAGTLTLGGTLAVASGGTGATTAAGALTALGAYPASNPNNYADGTVKSVSLTTPDIFSVSGTPVTSTGTIAITYSGLALPVANGGTGATTAAGALTALGAYPASNPNGYTSNTGTVTSVDASGGSTGLTLTGGPVTTTGTFTLGGTLAVASGGTGATTAAGARTNFGATTLGANLFTLTNPSAITFLRVNADNSVSTLDAATFRSAIGAGTGNGNGTVTSVGGTGTVNGITLTGTVTTSGSLTLGGTLSGVSLTTQVTGTLPIANGGTNATATPTNGGVSYGTGTAYAFTAAGTAGQVLTSNGAAAPTWSGISGGTF